MDRTKQYGHFSEKGDAYYITEPETPRHWYNYMYNDEYITFTSQVGYGEGFAQDDMGRRAMLVSNRNLFVSEDGKYFSICGLPMNSGYTDYLCTHKNGSTEISQKKNGIKSTLRIFVPCDGMREIWSVTLENTSDKERTLSLVSYAKTEVDGTYRPQGYNLATGGAFEDKNAVWGHFYTEFYPDPALPGRCRPMYAYMASSDKISGFDSRRNAFIGPYGDEQHPSALEKGLKCQNTDCNSEKLCLVLQNDMTLLPGEKKTVHFTLGLAYDKDGIAALSPDEVEKEFSAMENKYKERLCGIEISTPWGYFDKLINGWMKYAADMGSRWARVRHNGYRDLTSDTECLACVNPRLAWERLKRILTYQYDTGYAPRTIIDGAIRDRKFADNTVWMTFAADTIVKELGDINLLNEEVEFNNGTKASVYEHLRRSVDFLWNFTGLYGLVRIWGGDWNDCVNFAGLEGKGVSVWLTLAWYRANAAFGRLAAAMEKTDDAKTAAERGDIMRERIDKYGWDGEYYIYARTDDDIIMGSRDSEEGKIFLISQLWAVLSGAAKDGKDRIAMESADRILETKLGTRLAYPAYSHQYPYIGSMAEKAPGVQDNGGIYLHPSAWKLAADSMLHRPDKVEEGLKKMLVTNTEYETKCGEPYAMYNSYFAPETGYRYATPGQSWRTAASSWLLKSTVEYIFGLHPELEGLRIEPCLPLSWQECSIKKLFRGCEYNIRFVCSGESDKVSKIELDGKEIKPERNIIAPVGEKMNLTVYIG